MSQPQAKIASLEALRGLLALWVVVCHVTARIVSDATIRGAHFQALLEPLIPVTVFMILSGFVIFALLQREHPSYGAFVLRRFFRLAPLYFLVLMVAAGLTSFELRTLDNLFWRNSHVYDSIKIHHETLGYFWQHFAAHALLVQGMIPETWLADANFTFLSQGWSISLEWQFYLLAPILFALAVRRHYLLLALAGAALLALWSLNVPSIGFLPNQLGYFAIGIASFYAWRHAHLLVRVDSRVHDAGLLLCGGLIYLTAREPLPLLVWLVVLDVILVQRAGMRTLLTAVPAWILERPALQRLGEISYSVYLVHIPILYVVFRAVTKLNPHMGGWRFLVIALPLTVLATLAVALATYRWIEQPGIALGRALSHRWTRTPALQPAR
jgi:peptidoglycan/LPS O-acetylase OafA/YrhL